jgi:hypothetical protein
MPPLGTSSITIFFKLIHPHDCDLDEDGKFDPYELRSFWSIVSRPLYNGGVIPKIFWEEYVHACFPSFELIPSEQDYWMHVKRLVTKYNLERSWYPCTYEQASEYNGNVNLAQHLSTSDDRFWCRLCSTPCI